MNSKHHSFIGTLFLILGLITSIGAMAQESYYDVLSANPDMALQGTINLDVEISGNHFDNSIDIVDFRASCEDPNDPCLGAGLVTVNHFVVRGSKKIIANIDVPENATLPESYKGHDVEIRSSTRGRGGKGTTLFTVQEKVTGNQQFETCNEVFFGIPRNDPKGGPCNNASGSGECELLLGNPELIKKMMTDCTTTKTLVLPDEVLLTSATVQESGTGIKTLTAIDDWEGGSAVITNAGHRAQVGNLNIRIATTAASGCDGNGELQTAVSFVLQHDYDEDDSRNTEPPYPEGDPFYDGRASIFEADGLQVSLANGTAPLCAAVELIRKNSYTVKYGSSNDWKVKVRDSEIAAGSYVNTAIRLEGFKQQQDINPPTVSGNIIGAPDCEGGRAAFGIVHGPLIMRDNAAPQSEALLENNIIDMSDGDCDTTGILLLGGTSTWTAGNINSNYIVGATNAVVISEDTESVNLKGNMLKGDVGSEAGICSDIPIGEQGKPNKISGFSEKYHFGDCWP